MTITMLNQEFEAGFGVDGDVKKKAVRFFLQAAKASGMPLSKFLQDQTRASSGPRKKRGSTARKDADPLLGDDDADGDDETPPKGTKKTITLKSGGELSIALSVDLFELSTTDRTFVFDLIDKLRGYGTEDSAHVASAVGVKETP